MTLGNRGKVNEKNKKETLTLEERKMSFYSDSYLCTNHFSFNIIMNNIHISETPSFIQCFTDEVNPQRELKSIPGV